MTRTSMWSHRAAISETAVTARHLRPLWGVPGTLLGIVGWPTNRADRLVGPWHYWWQAHLLDCLVDAELRSPDRRRRRRIAALIRGIRLHNGGRWTNDYHDDMAWLGIALERARTVGLGGVSAGIDQLATTLYDAWSPTDGGIPWRRGDDFRNTPANGPAAILLARLGFEQRAAETLNWMLAELRDPGSGLVFDGVRPGGVLQRDIYTYCQGVVLGAAVELALRRPGHSGRYAAPVHDLVEAVDRELAVDGVLRGHGGGDGGLFTAILIRYLASVATRLPGDSDREVDTRRLAGRLVISSADAAWTHRAEVAGLPLFGADWAVPAVVPTTTGRGRQQGGATDSSAQPERDLSVQIGGWMVMEAAAVVTAESDAS